MWEPQLPLQQLLLTLSLNLLQLQLLLLLQLQLEHLLSLLKLSQCNGPHLAALAEMMELTCGGQHYLVYHNLSSLNPAHPGVTIHLLTLQTTRHGVNLKMVLVVTRDHLVQLVVTTCGAVEHLALVLDPAVEDQLLVHGTKIGPMIDLSLMKETEIIGEEFLNPKRKVWEAGIMEPPTSGEAMDQMLEATMVTMEQAGDLHLTSQQELEDGVTMQHLAQHLVRDLSSGMVETITVPPWPGGLMMEAPVSGEASLSQEWQDQGVHQEAGKICQYPAWEPEDHQDQAECPQVQLESSQQVTTLPGVTLVVAGMRTVALVAGVVWMTNPELVVTCGMITRTGTMATELNRCLVA